LAEAPDRVDSGDGSNQVSDEASKTMLVSALLDSVTSSINDTRPNPTEDESTQSNSPNNKWRIEDPQHNAESPTRWNPRASVGIELELADIDIELSSSDATIAAAPSDYGDDDFDDNTFIEIADSFQPGEAMADTDQLVSESGAPPARPAGSVENQLSDDFDDLEDNIFDASEDIMAQSSQSATAPKAVVDTRPAMNAPLEDDADDAFGDDFGGDFDFDAAELAATQMTRPSLSQSTIPVRGKT
jgi:DNA replication ATP-dependent helicase Dna2